MQHLPGGLGDVAQANHTKCGRAINSGEAQTRLNRIPRGFPRLVDYTVRARFRELVSGVPVLAEWELANTFRGGAPPYVQTSRVIDVRWRSAPVADTARR